MDEIDAVAVASSDMHTHIHTVINFHHRRRISSDVANWGVPWAIFVYKIYILFYYSPPGKVESKHLDHRLLANVYCDQISGRKLESFNLPNERGFCCKRKSDREDTLLTYRRYSAKSYNEKLHG